VAARRAALILAAAAMSAHARPALAHCGGSPPAVRQDLPLLRLWQLGRDYVLVPRQGGEETVPGRVLVEVDLLYTAETSLRLRQALEQWARANPGLVQLRFVPSLKWPHAYLLARMHYALAALGREDLQGALADWIWQRGHYRIYHTVFEPDVAGIERLNLEFARAQGIGAEAFLARYRDPSLLRRVVLEAARRYDAGVSILVAGRYGTNLQRLMQGQADIDDTILFSRAIALISSLAIYERGRRAGPGC
jgi:hypothetical protein